MSQKLCSYLDTTIRTKHYLAILFTVLKSIHLVEAVNFITTITVSLCFAYIYANYTVNFEIVCFPMGFHALALL